MFQRKRYVQAEKFLLKAFHVASKEHEDTDAICIQIVSLLHYQAKFEECEQWLNLISDDKETHFFPYSKFFKANCLIQRQKPKEALEQLAQIPRNWKHFTPNTNLLFGMAHGLLQEWEVAQSNFLLAEEILTNSYLYSAGVVAFNAGSIDLSRKYFEKMIEELLNENDWPDPERYLWCERLAHKMERFDPDDPLIFKLREKAKFFLPDAFLRMGESPVRGLYLKLRDA